MNLYKRYMNNQKTNTELVNHHYLLVSIWHFAASVEEALNPRFRNSPLAIIENEDSELKIVDCNAMAANLGIKKGLGLKKALQITPRLVIRPIQSNHLKGFANNFIKISKKLGGVINSNQHEILLRIPYSTPIERAAMFLKIQNICWQELECKIVAGFGSSPVLAKLANLTLHQPGFRYFDKADKFNLQQVPIRFLPGLGKQNALKLKNSGVNSVKDFINETSENIYSLLGRAGLALRYKVIAWHPQPDLPEKPHAKPRLNFGLFKNNFSATPA
ncbi:MAG: hypothetical protein COT26_00765 [Candidatus Kerfeldbacteria bacterium CG08_land_8_20_14_0_20_43_14]|uniref:UmuC domain-containing protein n=1 Tax=Candidatus Kerfeldbacteria bacterium CG08_land_8_20_14_0_20_43_14 TaxID=2014246 RepID=A0A2H0YT32_9BACT|nr:MAG: hypothetical protein COT26_00765 [Candidatus Kerfeldbacteria bacterium CG08_land_8_20_14_0_20_43_14]